MYNRNIKTKNIITSYYSEHLELVISDRYLKFCSIPWYPSFDEFIVEIQGSLGNIHLNKTMKRSNSNLDISSLKEGRYFINLYIANKSKAQKVALMHENIMIDACKDDKSFIFPLCYEPNMDFINNIPISENDLLKYKFFSKFSVREPLKDEFIGLNLPPRIITSARISPLTENISVLEV